ncbi:MAG: hypothetical protein KGS10_05495 [Chloroflexi bacterium]|nr:hypothetical protein [Chloroflexota bacterium]
MPLNLPTVTRDDISFGPARLFLGAAGATPTTDVGAITEDGVTLEFASETRDIMQGNPRLIELSFIQQQSVTVSLTSIEWNFNNLKWALGAGATSASGTFEKFAFGGEPCITEVALHIQHQMCRTGDTMNIYVWRAVGDGNSSLPFGQDEHQFEFTFKALRSATDWAGNSLAYDQQLISILRQI